MIFWILQDFIFIASFACNLKLTFEVLILYLQMPTLIHFPKHLQHPSSLSCITWPATKVVSCLTSLTYEMGTKENCVFPVCGIQLTLYQKNHHRKPVMLYLYSYTGITVEFLLLTSVVNQISVHRFTIRYNQYKQHVL